MAPYTPLNPLTKPNPFSLNTGSQPFVGPVKPNVAASTANSTPAMATPRPAVPAVTGAGSFMTPQPMTNAPMTTNTPSPTASTPSASASVGRPAIPAVTGGASPGGNSYSGYTPTQPATPSGPGTAPPGGGTLIGGVWYPPGTRAIPSDQGGTGPADPFSSPERKAMYGAIAAKTLPSQDEQDTQAKLDALMNARDAGKVNAEGQAIPLEFITGQQAAIEKRGNILMEPLQQKLARLQAARTASLEASKFALDSSNKELELQKPTAVTYGSSLVNPITGKTVSSTMDSGAQSLISKAISEGRLDTSLVTRYGLPAIVQTLQSNPTYDFNAAHTDYQRGIANSTEVRFDPVTGQMVTYNSKGPAPSGTNIGTPGNPSPLDSSNPLRKAAGTALIDQQKSLSDVRTGINTADTNFQLLVNTATKAGINDQSSPIINQLSNAVSRGIVGNGALNEFNTGIQTLRTEYARVLARGGQVSDSVRHEAEALIPDNISLANLTKVYNYIKQEGANVIAEREAEIGRLSGGANGAGSGSTAQAYQLNGKHYVQGSDGLYYEQ